MLSWLRQEPQRIHAHFLATCWTVAMLARVRGTQVSLLASARTLRAAVHRRGLRWRQPRLAMPRKTGPETAQKQGHLVAAGIAADPATAIVYAAESRVPTLPLRRARWSWVGQHWRVPTPGSHITRALFGALYLRTGQWTEVVRERLLTEDCLAFLARLLVVDPTPPLLLIVANC